MTIAQALADVAGYRLLSTPVQAVTVDALADVNLVQGIAGGAAPFEAQYPSAPANLYTDYTGSAYVKPGSTADVVVPGRGFFWQFYDRDITPDPESFGGGTSQSYALPGRQLTATGAPIMADHSVAFGAATSDRFYMIGNPFSRPVSASAITSSEGIQGDLFQAFNPVGNTYVQIFRAAGMGRTAAAVWQGFFAETVTGGAPTFAFDADAPAPASPTFIGRPAPVGAAALTLTGTTATGVETLDEASYVRFADGAEVGWDALDATKLVPLVGPYALVSPVIERAGSPYRVSVNTLPPAAAETVVPLDVLVTDAGTYTLTATVPQGWTAEVRDLATGARADAVVGYTFTSDATDWTGRLALALRPAGATAGEGTADGVTSLSTPRPNPATGRASLTLRIAAPERVTAAVIDALGRTVATLYDGDAPAGTDLVLDVDASRLAPGVYVVRVQGITFDEVRRLTVVR